MTVERARNEERSARDNRRGRSSPRRRLAVGGGLAAFGIAFLAVTLMRDSEPFRAPTEAEARLALAERVAAVAARPAKEAYCAGDRYADCIEDWNDAGGDAALPTTPPIVVSVRGGTTLRILDVCGRDGLGRPYMRAFVVRMDDGKVHALNAVYWLDHVKASANEPDSSTPSNRPPACP